MYQPRILMMKSPKLAIQSVDKLVFTTARQILYAVADGNYTKIYLNDNQVIRTLRQLGEISQQLPKDLFVRIHRSYLVNLEYVAFFESETESVWISNGQKLPVARDRKAGFLEQFTRI